MKSWVLIPWSCTLCVFFFEKMWSLDGLIDHGEVINFCLVVFGMLLSWLLAQTNCNNILTQPGQTRCNVPRITATKS